MPPSPAAAANYGRGFFCLWDPATGRQAGCFPEAYDHTAAPADCASYGGNAGGAGGGGGSATWGPESLLLPLALVVVVLSVALLTLVLAAGLALDHGWRGHEDESDRLLRAEVIFWNCMMIAVIILRLTIITIIMIIMTMIIMIIIIMILIIIILTILILITITINDNNYIIII